MFSEKYLLTLEYNKIREMLSELAVTEGAKKRALCLVPYEDIDRVKLLQARTDDAKALLSSKGYPSFFAREEILESVERAVKGAQLSCAELLDIASLLRSARSTADYFNTDNPKQTSLDEIFMRLLPNRTIEDKITRAIISSDLISDEASAELAEIRRKIKSVNNKIKDILAGYMGGVRLKYLQENIVTMRDGRYVIPVKSEYRSEIKGLLHDTSSSGATLFIEPIAIVEANNDLKVLASKEQAEIDRILFELSALCAEYSGSITQNYYNITDLSFYFACASLALNMKAVMPEIKEKPQISLKKARHPLLKASRVVPIDLSLGVDFDTMIITGPNTGGKTVTLKTLGLFVLMAQSGLQIPAAEGSYIGMFENVLVDLGDEQSIEQSLSTFSSHMVKIVDILDNAGSKSLVLFDELGAGTDPVEGAALAIAILEKVHELGGICASTTHYAELKAYALDTEGVENASCEFDVESLKPTYRLIVGAPGKSNAFAISQKLGLSDEVVHRAELLISNENKSFENVIEKLEENRLLMEKEKETAEQLRREFEEFKKKAEAELLKKTKEAEKEIEKTRQKAKELLDSARATSDYVLKQLEELKRKKESADLARAFNEAKNDIRNRLRDGLDLYDKTSPDEITFDDDYVLPRELALGDNVYLVGFGQEGIITALADKNGQYTVQSGVLKAKVGVESIRLIEKKAPPKKKPIGNRTIVKSSVAATFKPEIDVRGKYADDAWFAVDKYLDDAILSGVNEVRIIHGKGTGVLRKTIQEFLKGDMRVKTYRNGVYGEGEAGVTVVTLK